MFCTTGTPCIVNFEIHSDSLLSNNKKNYVFASRARCGEEMKSYNMQWHSKMEILPYLYYGRSKHTLWPKSKCQNLCTYSMCIHPHPTCELNTTNCILPLQPSIRRPGLTFFSSVFIPIKLTKLLVLWGDPLASPSQFLSNCRVRKKIYS